MFSNKLFHFLKGYVILYLTGFNIERFLYICSRRGIGIYDIKKLAKSSASVKVELSDFFKLRPIAYKTRIKVHIKRKAGLPVIFKKYRKRYFLIFGFLLFFAAMLLSSRFIWSVELVGVKNADTVQIVSALKSAGIYEGAPKRAAKSGKEIKDILLNRVDNISWAWVYLKGTKAICEIYEGRVPESALEESCACDVVAARDGIIKLIIATDGKRTVSAGDTVIAGEVLISGTLTDPYGNVGALVSADGLVEARTWHEKTDTYKLYEEYRQKTGNSRKFYDIKLFSKTFGLYFKEDIDYEDFDISKSTHEIKLFGDFYTGIAILSKNVEEVSPLRLPISLDMALYTAKCDLEERIARELLPGAELVDERLTYTMLDSETAEVTLSMEFVENIGMRMPTEQE